MTGKQIYIKVFHIYQVHTFIKIYHVLVNKYKKLKTVTCIYNLYKKIFAMYNICVWFVNLYLKQLKQGCCLHMNLTFCCLTSTNRLLNTLMYQALDKWQNIELLMSNPGHWIRWNNKTKWHNSTDMFGGCNNLTTNSM